MFVRLEPELGLESQKQRVLDRLVELRAAGAISDFDVFVWTRGVRIDGPLCETAYCDRLLEHVYRLRRWFERAGATCDAFEHRGVECPVTDEHYDVISLPSICLGVYEREALVDVYPRRMGNRVETVLEGAESLASHRVETID